MKSLKHISLLFSIFIFQTAIAQMELNEYIKSIDEFVLTKVTNPEMISEIKKRNTSTTNQSHKNSSKKTQINLREVESQSQLENLSYQQFKTLTIALFELSKDESTIEFAFEKVNELVYKYDFKEGLGNIGFYYFEKLSKIPKKDFKICYYNYLEKVPLDSYGKWNFWWKPFQLDSIQVSKLIEHKYNEIKSIPFNFEDKRIFEFTFKILPIWSLNANLNEFYPFLKEISNFPDNCKTEKGSGIYTINPNTKYATYLSSFLQALNYYTFKNKNISDSDTELITELLLGIDTYHHPVETKLYASILSNIYPSKTYTDFIQIFENVQNPLVAKNYWGNKKFNYKNLLNWFSNYVNSVDLEKIRKRLLQKKLENHTPFLNSKSNILDILGELKSTIEYDAEDGYIPVRYSEIFRENYLSLLEKDIGEIEIIQGREDELYVINNESFFSFKVKDYGDFVDSFTLSLLCNNLLKNKGSNKRVIPIEPEDQSSINLYLDIDFANHLINEFKLNVMTK